MVELLTVGASGLPKCFNTFANEPTKEQSAFAQGGLLRFVFYSIKLLLCIQFAEEF